MIQRDYTAEAKIQGSVNVYQDILIINRKAAKNAIIHVETVRMEMELKVIFE